MSIDLDLETQSLSDLAVSLVIPKHLLEIAHNLIFLVFRFFVLKALF